jgi:uncharacterized membrane protein YeaQ/YmgE (transglycosylase-associated protein family)
VGGGRALPAPNIASEGEPVSIILFLLFGLLVGFLARAIMPGRQSMGIVATLLLGVAGSFLGGFVVALFTHRRVLEFNTAGFIGSVLGALVVLFIYERVISRRGLKKTM